MKLLLHLLLLAGTLLATTIRVSAQDCGPERYANDIFTDASITKTAGIVYGQSAVKRYSTGVDSAKKDMLLDIYQPGGDAAVNRPLLVLAFGGGFISGDRSEIEPIARAFARKGYVVAAIDYRIVTNAADQQLLAPFPLSLATPDEKRAIVRDVIVKASADMRGAIRFFRHSAATGNTYRIDPNRIFLGGASAGAMAALYAAYMDNIDEDPTLKTTYEANGLLEGNNDLPAPNNLIGSYTSANIAGVINIAGALLDPVIVDANDPPLYSAHSTDDTVIPYESGEFTVLVSGLTITIPITFYGSKAITDRAEAVGIRNRLLPVPSTLHEAPGQPPYIGQIITESAAFMKVAVCGTGSPLPVKLVSFSAMANRCTALFNWQTALEENSSHFDIEFSADGASFNKAGTVVSKNASNGAAYSYQLDGAVKTGWYRLKMVDRDGSFTYSKAQRFGAKCDDIFVQVYPNPAQHKATVAGLQAGMLVEVLATDGKMIWSQRVAGTTVELPVASFAKGLMLVQVKSESGALLSSTKLMKN